MIAAGTVDRELAGIELAGGPHRVEHVRPQRTPDHVRVVAGGAEALVVGDRDCPAARQHHRHHARFPFEPAGEQPRRRRHVADPVRADRVADQRPGPSRAGVRDQDRARNGGRLARGAGRAVEDPPRAGADAARRGPGRRRSARRGLPGPAPHPATAPAACRSLRRRGPCGGAGRRASAAHSRFARRPESSQRLFSFRRGRSLPPRLR